MVRVIFSLSLGHCLDPPLNKSSSSHWTTTSISSPFGISGPPWLWEPRDSRRWRLFAPPSPSWQPVHFLTATELVSVRPHTHWAEFKGGWKPLGTDSISASYSGSGQVDKKSSSVQHVHVCVMLCTLLFWPLPTPLLNKSTDILSPVATCQVLW